MEASTTPLETGGDAVAPAYRFSKSYKVRFSHCDPAGIVFFPQYLIILNGFIEDWVTEGLGIDYYDFFLNRRVGLPTASLHCDFVRPSRMGETLLHTLKVDRVGRRSLSLAMTAAHGEEIRWRIAQTLVTVDLNTGSSIDLPSALRDALETQIALGTGGAPA